LWQKKSLNARTVAAARAVGAFCVARGVARDD
jgi:hypothetical protein